MTAIEYCYRYSISDAMGQQVTFNWTVVILEDAERDFMINSTYIVVQSHGSMGSANCTHSGGQVTCCDRTNINGFDLPTDFIFGVIASAQGNTRGVSLLGYSDALPQYRVDARLLGRGEVTSLSVGSNLRRSPGTLSSGIRMLWFVIGKH